MWLACLAFLLNVFAPPATAAIQKGQESSTQFFSGVVADIQSGRIVVDRRVPGKRAETKAFSIGSETKIEGRLEERVRVTVGYVRGETEDLAVRIIVRSSEKKP